MGKSEVEKLIWHYLPEYRVEEERRLSREVEKATADDLQTSLSKMRYLTAKKNAHVVEDLLNHIRYHWLHATREYADINEVGEVRQKKFQGLADNIHELLDVIPFEKREFFLPTNELRKWLQNNIKGYAVPTNNAHVFDHIQSMWDNFMNGDRSLWNYGSVRQAEWRRLRPRISLEIRGMVDFYFNKTADPAACWTQIQILLPPKWMNDRNLMDLHDLLKDCSLYSRFPKEYTPDSEEDTPDREEETPDSKEETPESNEDTPDNDEDPRDSKPWGMLSDGDKHQRIVGEIVQQMGTNGLRSTVYSKPQLRHPQR